ncbi:MAG: adenylyl-sulfate kinase, partial [Candidatus Roizmanbacteria bacterium]|nr:adenylyl-sulfate kinase [Candidatus Roizmanbacteria bacterium]
YDEMVYVAELDQYVPRPEVPDGATVFSLSGTELRSRIKDNKPIPPWFTYPEVVAVLKKETLPKHKQGVVLWFTGLSSSGKSTIAGALEKKLTEIKFENDGQRSVTKFDGDWVRQHLSKGLGFSKEDRATNVERVGAVAAEITKHGGAVICALISPEKTVREKVRKMVERNGIFIEIYVDTPLEVCEERDVKGLYAQARAGQIKNFTGISDSYEPPDKPELTIDTTKMNPEESAEEITDFLVHQGYINLGNN